MVIARTVRRQAQAQGDLQDVGDQAGVMEVVGGVITLQIRGDFGLIFERLSRSVRLTLALETRIAEGELARQARAAAEADLARAARGWTDVGPAEKRAATVRRVVAEALEREGGADVEALDRLEALSERLWERDEEFDGVERPIGAVIADICRDLGIEPDWDRWAGEDWAVEAAGSAGSPFVSTAFAAGDLAGAQADVREPSGSSP